MICSIKISFVSFTCVTCQSNRVETFLLYIFHYIYLFFYLSFVDLSNERIVGNVFICDGKHSIGWSLTILFVKEKILFRSVLIVLTINFNSDHLFQFGSSRFLVLRFLSSRFLDWVFFISLKITMDTCPTSCIICDSLIWKIKISTYTYYWAIIYIIYFHYIYSIIFHNFC